MVLTDNIRQYMCCRMGMKLKQSEKKVLARILVRARAAKKAKAAARKKSK